MSDPIKSKTAPAQAAEAPPGARKERTGRVVSAKMQKTLVVEVIRRVPHARYGKIVKRRKKFYAHDEKSAAKAGDVVTIRETRPLSRLKRWELVAVHGGGSGGV